MGGQTEDLLRRLAYNEESSARAVLTLAPGRSNSEVAGLTPKLTALVRLAALIALDAPTPSLCWAAEQAACAGASVGEIVGVLVTVAPEVGLSRVVSAAPRVALAIGYETGVEPDDWGLRRE
ncbi:MAG TPA: hypothetical protein VGL51_16770 [Solirubrobacteraceae bacterium]|jgi:alkylhydroperoxidase/carboxymuconolactone decarboxylase family protein YurZ